MSTKTIELNTPVPGGSLTVMVAISGQAGSRPKRERQAAIEEKVWHVEAAQEGTTNEMIAAEGTNGGMPALTMRLRIPNVGREA